MKKQFLNMKNLYTICGISIILLLNLENVFSQVQLSKKWEHPIKGSIYSSPMIGDVTGDGVYDIVVGDQSGQLTVINGQTGDSELEYKFNGSINVAPIVADFGNNNLFDILVCTDKGRVYLFDPRIKSILWQWSAQTSIEETPALGNLFGKDSFQLLVTDDNANVYCLTVSESTVTAHWMTSLKIPITTSPVIYSTLLDKPGEIIIGCSDGNIIGLDGKTGERKYKFSTGGRISSTPAVGDTNKNGTLNILIGSEDQYIYSFAKGQDVPTWKYKTNDKIILSPALTSPAHQDTRIVCVSKDRSIYIMESTTGKVLWSYSLTNDATISPILVDINQDGNDDVLIGTETGEVDVIDGVSHQLVDSKKLDSPITSIEVGDIDNNSKLDILVSTQQKVYLFGTGTPISTPNALLWPTVSGNPTRSGQLDPKYLSSIASSMVLHRNEVESVYKNALILKDAKEWGKATLKFQEVLSLNSNHPDAQAQIRTIHFLQIRPMLLRYVIGVLTLLLLMVGLWFYRRLNAKSIKEARQLLQDNQIDIVLQKYGKLIHKKDSNLLSELALAYARKGATDPDVIKVYEEVIQTKHFAVTPTEVHYILAKVYSKDNRSDNQSRLIYDIALQYKPEDRDVLRAYGRACRANNDNVTMVHQYEKLFTLGEKDNEIILNLARGYLLTQRNDAEAIQIYQQAVELNSDEKELITHLADIYLGLNKIDDKTLSIFEQARVIAPDNSSYVLAIAQYNNQKKQYKKALDIALPILQTNLQTENVFRITGESHLGLKEYSKAVELFEKCIQINPQSQSLIENLAFAYHGARNSGDRAMEIIKSAVKQNPTSLPLRGIIAHAYVERCDRENALESLLSYQQLDSKHPELLLPEYEALAISFPSSIEIRKTAVTLQLQLNSLTKADETIQAIEKITGVTKQDLLDIYLQYLKKDSINSKIRFKRAEILFSMNKWDEAISDLETINQSGSNKDEVQNLLEKLYLEKLQQNDSNLSYHYKMGVLLYSRGDVERAIEHLQKTVKEKYREQESGKYLGLCFQKRGMLDLAHRQFTKLPLDVDMKEILYNLANDYTELHQFSKALSVLEQIYAEDINYKDLKTTITKLRERTLSGSPTEATLNLGQGLSSSETVMMDASTNQPTKKQRFEILKELGRGNMGIVCLAQDKELDETVALKFLPQELHYDAMIVERFKQEVRSTRRLSHPHIVRIHDMGDEGGRKFISMEYIDGRDLKGLLHEKKSFLPTEVIQIGAQICSALDYAHRSKVVHRDIKPANIMMTKDGDVKIMDFGIASMLERAGLTQTGALIGTPLYMSPEQSEGKQVDGRTDIYSFGVMLYELISGMPPFYSGNISYQHVHVPPPPLEKVPECIANVIMKCLAKKPEDRYQTAGECGKALEKCRDQITNIQ